MNYSSKISSLFLFKMISNKYNYVIIDFSYVLQRNLFVISKGKEVGEYTYGELIRMMIWTINKLARDYGLTSDKVVLIYDKWDKELGGYYTTYLLGGQYKDTRKYMTEEVFQEIKSDPTKTPEEIHKAELELYQNQVKYKAKWSIIGNGGLGNFGIPCIGLDGWEADNLAWLASCLLYGKGDKPNILVTKDSDWQYLTNPSLDFFKMPKSGESPKVITYDEMYCQIPESIRNRGIGLYQYKSLVDSIDGSHNDMRRTRKDYANLERTILEVLDGDYSNIEDLELFKKQYNSFDISRYPRFEEAKRLITDVLPTCGRLGSIPEFHTFCDKHKIEGISDRYFTEFISRFDPKLYCER